MKPGFKGKDSMRAQAEKALGKGARANEGPTKMSKSTPSNLKPRLYNKGGKVKKCNEGGFQMPWVDPGIASPTRLPQPSPINPNAKGITPLKKGGKAKKLNVGGMLPPEGEGVRPPMGPLGGMKKGGKVKKMAMGGVGKIRHKEATKLGKPKKMPKKKVVF